MDRRELLGVLGAGSIGLATLSRTAAGADEEHHHHHDKVHEDCMKACSDAHATRRPHTASSSSARGRRSEDQPRSTS